jgi:hypothetical protein
METTTDRITRYLLKRSRRQAVLDLYESASVAGLLESRFLGEDEKGGTAWSISEKALNLLTGDTEADRKIIGRALGRARPVQPAVDDDGVCFPGDQDIDDQASVAKDSVLSEHRCLKQGKGEAGGFGGLSAGHDQPGQGGLATVRMLSLLREHLPPPNPVQVAVALLLARAVGTSLRSPAALLAVLRRPAPFVLVKVPVDQFERRFGMMLEDGLVVPFRCELTDVLKGMPISDRYQEKWRTKSHRSVATLSGRAASKASEKILRRNLADVLLGEACPIVVADQTPLLLSPLLATSPDLVLACEGIDRDLIVELLQVCLGIAPKHAVAAMDRLAFDPAGLGLDDLALTVRPGRDVAAIIGVLDVLAERNRSATAGEDGGDADDRRSDTGSGSSSRGTGGSSRTAKDKAASFAGEVVEPEPFEEPAGGGQGGQKPLEVRPRRPPLRIENLAGYGEARTWATELKDDLTLWREGALDWDEMSTRLLLSGPPGTGKTTFARALGNTLQVPMIATSVANWLEPGYLGDVLKRITATFDTAKLRAPCILFIDEIDNIGNRGGDGRNKQYDDYWTSLINRLLELLDGALKTEGIIVVGATNLPDRIDPALLRSGRLEKHVMIPPPDTDALAGILAHHLGEDLGDVLASAPKPGLAFAPTASGGEGRAPPPAPSLSENHDNATRGPGHG